MCESTVFVVDDDPAARESMVALFESAGLTVETFGNGEAFLSSYDPGRLGCLVLDVRMPGMSGLQLQEQLEARDSALPIIFVSGNGDVPLAVQSMRAGAVDFLEKPYRPQDLLDRVVETLAFDRERRAARDRASQICARLRLLTRREKEVFQLLVEGKSTRQIARNLQLSPKTIHVYRAETLSKMQAGSVAELVRMALAVRAIPEYC